MNMSPPFCLQASWAAVHDRGLDLPLWKIFRHVPKGVCTQLSIPHGGWFGVVIPVPMPVPVPVPSTGFVGSAGLVMSPVCPVAPSGILTDKRIRKLN